MKEGQTQEPVGGMKWEDVQILAKKHADKIIEMGWRDNPDRDDIIADFKSGYYEASLPQSSNLKEGDFITGDFPYKESKSSTEEEKDLWTEVISEIEINDFISTKYEDVINNLRSKIKISRR